MFIIENILSNVFANSLLAVVALTCFSLAFLQHRKTLVTVLSISSFVLLSILFAYLIYVHLKDDFTFLNVYMNSSIHEPFLYKISGVWGNHEGSMLLWLWELSLCKVVFLLSYRKNSEFKYLAIAIQGILCGVFTIFTLFTSNPFTKISLHVYDGLGFNPLLQDFALAIHPPLLYLGYTTSSIVFSATFACLLKQTNTKNWIQVARPWTLGSCAFLTLGIGFGSWWSYRELGWGGFWSWDPVENVALLPWLLEVMLLHLFTTPLFVHYRLIIALLIFSCSIFSTFIVRSGLISSIHAFALVPIRSVFLLFIFILITGSGLLIFLYKTKNITLRSTYNPAWPTRMILLSNVLFITAFFTIFIGVLYPLLLEYFTAQSITVGAPYYNKIFVVLTIIALSAMALANKLSNKKTFNRHRLPIAIALCVTLFSMHKSITVIILLFVSTWLLCANLYCYICNIKRFSDLIRFQKYSMLFAHCGIGMLILGIALYIGWSKEYEQYMHIKDSVFFVNRKLTLVDVRIRDIANYQALQAIFTVQSNNTLEDITPEYRFYTTKRIRMPKAYLYNDYYLSNLYILIGDIDKKRGIAVKFYYKCGIKLIWLSFLLIFLGIAITIKNKLPCNCII